METSRASCCATGPWLVRAQLAVAVEVEVEEVLLVVVLMMC